MQLRGKAWFSNLGYNLQRDLYRDLLPATQKPLLTNRNNW